MRKLNEDSRGGRPYCGRSPYSRPLPALEAGRRRRLRLGLGKQGRSGRTTVPELLTLGTAKKTALLTAGSRKGPGQLARPRATQTGRTKQGLAASRGLVSMRARWLSRHSPPSTASCGPAC